MNIKKIPWERIWERINEMHGVRSPKEWEEDDRISILQDGIRAKVNESIANDIDIAKHFITDSEEYETFCNSTYEQRKKFIAVRESRFERQHFGTILPRTLISIMTQNDLASRHRRIKNCFSIYVTGKVLNYEESPEVLPDHDENPASAENKDSQHSNEKLSIFIPTYWKAYYFHYDEDLRKGLLGMTKLLIEGVDKVEFGNIIGESSSDYEGSMSLEKSNQHIVFDLYGDKTQEKHVRITAFIGIEKVYPLLLGIYTNIYSSNSMVAGTIVLEKVDKEVIEELMPATTDFDNCDQFAIDRSIVTYLRSRAYNFIKAPSGILTKRKLGQWLKGKSGDKNET